jgi:hypothetical protein
MRLTSKPALVSKTSFTLILLTLLNLTFLLWQAPIPAQAATQPQLLYINPGGALTVANADGTGAKSLVSPVLYARWSPDGSKIAYVQGTRQSNSFKVGIINPDGSNSHLLEGNSTSINWSPDSQHLAYLTSDQLIIVNADGSNPKKASGGNSTNNQAFWSPKGDYLIYGFLSPATATSGGISTDVYSINSDGTNQRKLFNIPSGELCGFWVDGSRLLIDEVKPEELGIGAEGQLAIVNQDGTNKQILPQKQLFGSSRKAILPSPDGSKLLFSSYPPSVADTASPATSKTLEFTDTFISAAIWSNNPGKILAILVAVGGNYSLEEIDANSLQRKPIVSKLPVTEIGTDAAFPFSDFALEPGGLAVFTDLAGTVIVADTSSGKVNTLSGQRFSASGGWRPSGSSSGGTTYGNILPDFYNVWKQSDLAVATGQSNRSWLWGPDAFATKTEEYKEAKGGQRQVQYFDKARMEINNPDGDRSSLYFVTNGLLPKELIGGYIQTGDNQSQPKAPAEVNVAGDPDGSITYARLQGVVTLEPGKNTAPNRVGQPITATIDRSGKVGDGANLPGVTLAQYISETGHNIPSVFVDYFKTLPQDWVFVMGFPISEPYLTEITLSGKPTQAVIQVYERRVLTYTPSNSPAFRVEQGNVGQHYYKWRYGG